MLFLIRENKVWNEITYNRNIIYHCNYSQHSNWLHEKIIDYKTCSMRIDLENFTAKLWSFWHCIMVCIRTGDVRDKVVLRTGEHFYWQEAIKYSSFNLNITLCSNFSKYYCYGLFPQLLQWFIKWLFCSQKFFFLAYMYADTKKK